jgi:hypothetical protein
MALLRRRDRPRAELLVLLDRDERVASFADIEGGGTLLATSRGLWWPAPSGPTRLAWHLIDKAVWRDGVLTVIAADLVDDLLLVDRAPMSVPLAVPRDLPSTVRRRIEASLVRSELAAVPGGVARFVGRRVSGQDGVRWWARLERGTRDTPAVRDAVSAHVTALGAAWDAAD